MSVLGTGEGSSVPGRQGQRARWDARGRPLRTDHKRRRLRTMKATQTRVFSTTDSSR